MSIPIPEAACLGVITVLALAVALLAWNSFRLRKQNAYMHRLFEQSSQAVAFVSADGLVVRINQQFSRLTGYSPQQALGTSLSDLIVPDELREQYQEQLISANQGQRRESEGLCRRKDGSFFPAALTSVPIARRTSQAAAYLICRDITDQKRAEQARSADEGRWRAVFDNSAVGISVTDAQGRLTASNRAYQEMVGYSQEELRGMTYMDLTFEDDRPRNAALNAQLTQGKRQQFRLEKRYRRKDGRLIWVRVTVSHIPATASMPGFGMGIVEDITEQKLAEERLREYEKVVEGAREMIVVVDRDYRHLIANQAFLNYRGLTRGQVIGYPVPDFAGIDLFQNVLKPKLDECFQGRAVEFEMVCNSTRLGQRDLFVSYFPIEGPQGIDRVAGVLVDITDEKRAKSELQRSFSQLRALTAQLQTVREEERSRLARELHDELGQALTAIKIDMASLQSAAGREQPSADIVSRIGSIMNYIDRTIHSVRRISTELRPGILDDLGLVAALEWATEEFQGRTGILCHATLPEADLPIEPERATALFRIFQETLTNVARHAGASRVNIRLAQENGDLFLAVHDNGSGIGDRYLSGSLGILGMRERALLLGGDFDIAPDPAGGTTVCVRIPRHQ